MQTIIAHWRAFRLTAVTRLFVNLNIHRPTTSLIAATSKSDRCSPDRSEREVRRDRLGICSEPPATPCSAMNEGLGLFEILHRKLKLKAFLSATVEPLSTSRLVYVEPILVMEKPSQRFRNLPLLVPFTSGWKKPGIEQHGSSQIDNLPRCRADGRSGGRAQ
jgi:hypothetical protein